MCYLEALYTDPDVRGRGVGRALIQGAYRAAQAAGANPVYWQTHVDNAAGQRLYETVADNEGSIAYSQAV